MCYVRTAEKHVLDWSQLSTSVCVCESSLRAHDALSTALC